MYEWNSLKLGQKVECLGNMKNGSGSKQKWINEWVKYDRRGGKNIV